MGEVWKARDTRLGREVAVEVLPSDLSADAERLARFEQEARSASALNHSNIVTVYDVGRSDSTSYIAMELVEGKTLREMLAEGPLPTRRMLSLAAQVADGLAKAHAAGIVHRDLKPENLMVSRDGFIKIMDFGLAKLAPVSAEGLSEMPTAAPQQTASGVVLGTVGYMSPEQASGRAVDFRSDQFTFGSILYEMVTGRRAFSRPTAAETLAAIIRGSRSPCPPRGRRRRFHWAGSSSAAWPRIPRSATPPPATSPGTWRASGTTSPKRAGHRWALLRRRRPGAGSPGCSPASCSSWPACRFCRKVVGPFRARERHPAARLPPAHLPAWKYLLRAILTGRTHGPVWRGLGGNAGARFCRQVRERRIQSACSAGRRHLFDFVLRGASALAQPPLPGGVREPRDLGPSASGGRRTPGNARGGRRRGLGTRRQPAGGVAAGRGQVSARIPGGAGHLLLARLDQPSAGFAGRRLDCLPRPRQLPRR